MLFPKYVYIYTDFAETYFKFCIQYMDHHLIVYTFVLPSLLKIHDTHYICLILAINIEYIFPLITFK